MGGPRSDVESILRATARRFCERGGGSVEDATAVAVKNRAHPTANPPGRFRVPVTAEQMLGSRMIADRLRLRLLLCSRSPTAPPRSLASPRIVELADQLRARCEPRQIPGARHAFAQSRGGQLASEEAVAVATLLSRP